MIGILLTVLVAALVYLILAWLTVPIVENRIDAARDAQETADLVDLASRVGSAVQELQEERLLSIGSSAA